MNNTAPQAPPRAITVPFLDAFCCGGVSIAVVVALVAGGMAFPGAELPYSFYLIMITESLINFPHFMASYRLLYSSRKTVREHLFVAVILPVLMLGIVASCVAYEMTGGKIQGSAPTIGLMALFSPFAPILLGWHYTGQAWGMTACFAYIGGLRIELSERRMLLLGLRTLWFYHVILVLDAMEFHYVFGTFAEDVHAIIVLLITLTRVAVFVTFLVGLEGFRRIATREQKKIPIRCWLPWGAIFAWYVMADMHRGTFVLLQVFHSLQYMVFPLRVEFNQYRTNSPDAPMPNVWRHIMLYYLALVVVGLFAFKSPELATFAVSSEIKLAAMISAAINMHHYCTDSVVWKIRNPEVQQALFGHLKPAT